MLNNMCVPVGLEDASASATKLVSKQGFSQYEDGCFELDMITDSAYTSLAVLESMSSLSYQRAGEDQYGSRFASCRFHPILKLYGEHGIELLELLHKAPPHAVPVLVNRLKRRAQPWRGAQEALVEHNPSLMMDPCQAEQQIALPRYLVQDILDTKTDVYLQLGRLSIQRMLFHLIYNAAEQSSILQSDKQLIIKFWQHFFSHFVELSADDIVKRKHHDGSIPSTNIQLLKSGVPCIRLDPSNF